MPETLLEVKNCSISFDKDKPLFKDVSFNVREHDVLVLQGKSGSGCVFPLFKTRLSC